MQPTATNRRRFLYGLLLAWAPLLCLLPGLYSTFRGVSTQKATGLGAVAGGLTEFLVIVGLVALVVSQLFAIRLLAGELSRKQPMRTFVAVVSIGWGAFLLLLAGGFVFLNNAVLKSARLAGH